MIACLSRTDSDNVNVDPHPEGYRKVKADFDLVNAPFVAAVAKFEKEDLPNRLQKFAEVGESKNPSWIAFDDVVSPSEKILTTKEPGEIGNGREYKRRIHTYLKNITGFRIDAPPGKKFVPLELKVTAAPLTGKGKEIALKLRALPKRD